jgi:transcriptional regulator with XRE-family HTH domain
MVEQLREAIRDSGQSLNQLAKTCGVGPDRLSRFLRGQRDLTFEAASRVCEALHLELTPQPGRPEPEAAAPKRPKQK